GFVLQVCKEHWLTACKRFVRNVLTGWLPGQGLYQIFAHSAAALFFAGRMVSEIEPARPSVLVRRAWSRRPASEGGGCRRGRGHGKGSRVQSRRPLQLWRRRRGLRQRGGGRRAGLAARPRLPMRLSDTRLRMQDGCVIRESRLRRGKCWLSFS